MEAFFAWLLQNVAWDTLKKALPRIRQRDLNLFKQALVDAQARLKELEQDRALLEKLVDQRNRAIAQLIEANRRIAELEAELAKLRKKRR